MEWISVKDRIPEKNGWYMTRSKFFRNHDDFLNGNYTIEEKFLEFTGDVGDCVTHWKENPPEE